MSSKQTQLTAPSGSTYYINSLSADMQKAHQVDSLLLYQKRVNVFFQRNLSDPLTTLAELRMWFKSIRQPTQSQVRQAMLLTIDDDYMIKAGGGAIADSMFSSSLKWLQAHPVTGEDYEPVIIKKFSDSFENVLITFEDIEFLIEKTLTTSQRQQGAIQDVEDRVAAVWLATACGKINMILEKGQPAKMVPFTPELRGLILSKIDTDAKKTVAQTFITSQLQKIQERIDWCTMPGHGILGKDNSVCPIQTALYIERNRQDIRRFEQIRLELQGRSIAQPRPQRSVRQASTYITSQLPLFA